MRLNETVVLFLLGLVLPVITGLVTKYSANPGIKIITSIIVGGVATLVVNGMHPDGGAFLTQEALIDFAIVMGTQVTTYLGIYRPLDANANLAPRFGLGADDYEVRHNPA